jgi:hypothetical protein
VQNNSNIQIEANLDSHLNYPRAMKKRHLVSNTFKSLLENSPHMQLLERRTMKFVCALLVLDFEIPLLEIEWLKQHGGELLNGLHAADFT